MATDRGDARVGWEWGLSSSLGNREMGTASDSHSCKLFLVSTLGDVVGTQLLRPMLAFWPWLFCLVYRWPQRCRLLLHRNVNTVVWGRQVQSWSTSQGGDLEEGPEQAAQGVE